MLETPQSKSANFGCRQVQNAGVSSIMSETWRVCFRLVADVPSYMHWACDTRIFTKTPAQTLSLETVQSVASLIDFFN